MQTTKIEIVMIEAATLKATQDETRELDDLQLALVGGGNAIVTLG